MDLIKDGNDAIYKDSLIKNLQSKIGTSIGVRTITEVGLVTGKLVSVNNNILTIINDTGTKKIQLDDIIDVV